MTRACDQCSGTDSAAQCAQGWCRAEHESSELAEPEFETPEDEEAYWQAQGARLVLDSMDLPDGAYCAMADEFGLDPW